MRARYSAQCSTASCRAGGCEGVTESDVPVCGLAEPLLHHSIKPCSAGQMCAHAYLPSSTTFSIAQLSRVVFLCRACQGARLMSQKHTSQAGQYRSAIHCSALVCSSTDEHSLEGRSRKTLCHEPGGDCDGMLCQRAIRAALTSEVSASTEGQCCAGTTLQVRQRSHCTHWSVSGSGAAAAGAAPEALLIGVGVFASDLPPSSADGISCGATQPTPQDSRHGVLLPKRISHLCQSAVAHHRTLLWDSGRAPLPSRL